MVLDFAGTSGEREETKAGGSSAEGAILYRYEVRQSTVSRNALVKDTLPAWGEASKPLNPGDLGVNWYLFGTASWGRRGEYI